MTGWWMMRVSWVVETMGEVPYALIRLYISVRNGEISARSTERSRELIPETTGSMHAGRNERRDLHAMGATTPNGPVGRVPYNFWELGLPYNFCEWLSFFADGQCFTADSRCVSSTAWQSLGQPKDRDRGGFARTEWELRRPSLLGFKRESVWKKCVQQITS